MNDSKEAGIAAPNKLFRSPLVYHSVRVLFGIIFLGSGISKLTAPKEFAFIIENYGLIPGTWIMPAALILSTLEVAAGLGLLLDIRGSLAVVTGLLILFVSVLSYGIWLGLDIDCGCFGPEDPQGLATHGMRSALLRDLIMMLGILYLYYHRFRQNVTPNRLSNSFKIIRKEED